MPVSERLHFVARGSASRTARRAVREQIAAKGWSGDADAAVLLTGELVANAILHAGSITELRVTIDDGCLKVEADDRSDALPRVRSPGLSGTTGRGLLLVDRLSLRWGTDQLLGGGKTVWFEMSEMPSRPGGPPGGGRGSRGRSGGDPGIFL